MKGSVVDQSDEARRQARDESESKETPQGGSRLLALADESRKPYEMQTRSGKSVRFGWYAETPSEWLGLIEARVRSVRRYADTAGAKTLVIWGALVDLQLLIDSMEAHMLLKVPVAEWHEPVVQVPTRRRTIAT